MYDHGDFHSLLFVSKVLRALGVLGALDPFKVKLYSGQVDTFGDTGIAVSLHEADEKKDGEAVYLL